MKTHAMAVLPLSLLLAACAAAPPQGDAQSVSAAIAQAVSGAPRLPLAQEAFPGPAVFDTPLTIERAVQIALLNHPRVRIELARLDAVHAERLRAGLLRNPVVSLIALRPDDGGRIDLEYGLMQSLFDLFSRSRRVALANATERRVEAEVAGQLIAIAQDAQAAYYEALTADAALAIQRQLLVLEEDALRLLQRTEEAGASLVSETQEQRVATALRRHAVQSAGLARTQAHATLARQLGISSMEKLQLVSPAGEVLPADLDEAELRMLAARHRTELHAAAAGVDEARAEIALQSGGLVTLDPVLGPMGTRETDGSTSKGVQAQLTLPVFDRGGPRRDLARARLAQAEATADATGRSVSLQVEAAVGALLISQADQLVAVHHVQWQQQLSSLARRLYEQGAADYDTRLRAERSALAAGLDSIEAQRRSWLAAVELQRSTGVSLGTPARRR